MDEVTELRREIDHAVETGRVDRAIALLKSLMRRSPSVATSFYAVGRFEALRGMTRLRPYRIAIVRSFTVEPLVPLLRARAFAAGFDLHVRIGGISTYAQELLDPASLAGDASLDCVFVALRTPDVAAPLWNRFPALSPGDVDREAESTARDLESWVSGFRRSSGADLVIHSLEMPALPANGVRDDQDAHAGQQAAIRYINDRLRELAARQAGTYVLDYDALMARHGRLRWTDEHKWQAIKLPVSADGLSWLADEYMRFLHPLAGAISKAIAVDLDNTLWGGILGEEGIDGIAIGVEYPGSAFLELQRALRDLAARGVLLAVCSKNNRDEALHALASHPQVLLRPDCFAALQINWDDKVTNLQRLATELSIGVDALAFLDDNPAERENVRLRLPEVFVVDLPPDPVGYARAVREAPVFERLQVLEEDKERTRYYSEQRHREALASAATPEDFLRGLQMRAVIAPVSPRTLPRIAQLTQKTNQFNLTTRRYTETDIRRLMDNESADVMYVRLRDKVADLGIIGVAIMRSVAGVAEIDSFLMSCRALGRGVESVMLDELRRRAEERGCSTMRGLYIPTAKNAQVAAFYQSAGFNPVGDDGTRHSFIAEVSTLPRSEKPITVVRINTPQHRA
jgi:FkbH-like protein